MERMVQDAFYTQESLGRKASPVEASSLSSSVSSFTRFGELSLNMVGWFRSRK